MSYFILDGANSDSDMMHAIIGREPVGYEGKVKGYELCIQTWDEIPENVKNILSLHWDSNFRTYCIRRADNKSVWGRVWILTREERDLVNDWEIVPLWYKGANVIVKNGYEIEAETEIIDDPKIKQTVSSRIYAQFLNSKSKMIEVATRVRGDHLKTPHDHSHSFKS